MSKNMVNIGLSDLDNMTLLNLQSASISALVSAFQDEAGNISITIGILEDRGPEKIFVTLQQSDGETGDYVVE